MTVHGGDVWRVSEDLGVSASEILDFSANINPRGLPPAAYDCLIRNAANRQLLSFYPDPSGSRLRRALSRHLSCAPEAIVVGPGAESLIVPILRYLRPRRALIPIPAFSEYRRVCALENVEFVPFPLVRAERFRTPVDRFCENIKISKCDLVFINNPHNPSGSVLNQQDIRNIIDTATLLGVPLILDEAFVDYLPHVSVVSEAAARSGVIVIRSLTKFYGCPALRVGYAVAHPESIQRIQELLPTWPITQIAMDSLAEAVADTEYAKASLLENEKERKLLSEGLSALGMEVFPSAANYLFLELQAGMPTASELRSRLIARHKILIRNCDSYEGLDAGRYVRVAVRSRAENERLVNALIEESDSR
jgi:threonine-phosphate decarboxylase